MCDQCTGDRSKMVKAASTVLMADETRIIGQDEICIVEFNETGFKVVQDTRRVKVGYLHICDLSAGEITDACRDQIIKYLFNHPAGLPGVGKTPQHKYFAGLKTVDVERIGNEGKNGYYI